MANTSKSATDNQIPSGAVSIRNNGQDSRDFCMIYWTTFALCLVSMPMRRALGATRPGNHGPRSMLAQAQAEASIVACYALMGF